MSAEPVVTTVYSMPYAPDDYFYYEKSIRKLYRSGAKRAAEKFGQTEAALDVGHAYGQNIVTGFNETPTLDLSPVYVRLAGIEGAFLLDAASYAWNSDGMVVSSDLMLVGVTGYDGLVPPPTSWLRLPVAPASIAPAGVTTIEASPAKANSIAIPEDFSARNPGPVLAALPTDGVDVFREWRDETVVVPPALVLEQFSVAAGPVITLQEFDYPLTLPADVVDLATGPVAEGFAGAVVPAVVVAVAAAAPGISIGVRVLTPAATIGLNALPPLVVGGASVAVPAAGVAVAGVVPDLVGRQRTQVLVPVAGVAVAGLVPTVASGASVAVPVAGVTVAGVVPVIQPAILDPSFSSVSLLLHMNGTDNSTTFTDNSSLGLSVSVFGNARISTAQSKFSGASGLFDGNGDYLLATSSGFSFGTGDFTVEGWMYNVDGSGYRAIASFNLGNDNNSLYINSSTLVWYDGANRATSASFSSSTWHHFAATRASGVIRVFLNGVKSSSDYTASANITSGSVRIGTRGSANGEWFNGYLDDLRITKGVARYTANFTPPTAPFPDA